MLRRLLPIALIVAVAAVADVSGVLRPLNAVLGDFRMATVTRAPTGKIVLVDIDARSLAAVGQWPWPRSIHAALVDKLRVAGADTIALDIDFSTASTPAEDGALVEALKRANGAVILAAFRQRDTGSANSAIVFTQPLPQFAEHAWIATVNVDPDADGFIRRADFGDTVGGTIVPSLPAMLAGGAGTLDREFLVDYGIDAGGIDRISASDLLAGTVSPERIRGKAVILGSDAVELHDFFHVPVYGVVAGSMAQALAAESLLQQRNLSPSGSGTMLAGLAVLGLAFFLMLGQWRWRVLLATIVSAAAAIEGGAVLIQALTPVSVESAAWLTALGGFGLAVLLREIDFRRIMLLISRTQTRNTQTILDRVVHDNFAGVLVIDDVGDVRAASRAAETILGISNLTGRKAAAVLPDVLMDAVREAIALRKVGMQPHAKVRELALGTDESGRRILEYSVTPSNLAGGVSIEGKSVQDRYIACVTFSDVTERHHAAARIEKLARFDRLTGLPNRNEFMERLDAELAAGENVAVLCVDLDRFKAINETLGHSVGDLLLTAVARRLADLVPNGTTARVGGDAFALMLSGPGAMERAKTLAERLIARVGEPFQLGPHRLIASLSIGLAGGRTDPQLAFKQAEAAHYGAKAAGGNCWMTFREEMLAGVESRQEMEMALWEALERGEFQVVYQPQVDLVDRRIIGVEALLRWQHPTKGDIPPSDFISVAEAAGLIQPLGEWVLRTACAEVASWPIDVNLAVNVSAVQFTRGDLVATVAEALASSGLAARRLELEITESLLVAQSDNTARQIQTLAAKGVRFALDDFGTGYSSLGYLTRFAISKIKLDRSFVAGIPHDPTAVAVVQSVGVLANSLSILLMAEGIESAEQVDPLRLLGCKEGQGYLFGKAVPARAFLELLDRPQALTG